MAAKKASGARKYGKAASRRVTSAMHRRKKGTVNSGSGHKVRSRKADEAFYREVVRSAEKAARKR